MSERLFGYRHKARQPCAIIGVGISADALDRLRGEDAIRDLDQRLEDYFAMAPQALPISSPAGVTEAAAVALCWRLLCFARTVREAGSEPVFEPGRPITLRPATSVAGDITRVAIRAAVPAPIRASVSDLETLYADCAILLERLIGGSGRLLSRGSAHQEVDRLVQRTARRFGGLGDSSYQLLKAAWAIDRPFHYLGNGIFQIGWGSGAIRIDRSVTVGDSSIGSRLSQNKAGTGSLLAQAGLPAPTHRLVRNEAEAQGAAAALGWPVVVKPVNRDRGEGVSIGVSSTATLAEAFRRARTFSPQILVEQQVPGVCHRIFIARGRLLYAVRRDPKSVFGNGSSTVRTLIDEANARNQLLAPWLRSEPWPVDALAQQTLAPQGLSLDAVPEHGRKVALRPIESTQWGGDDEDMTAIIHPENVRLAETAARLIGLENAGVDLMSVDVSRPWYENGAMINEINYAPTLGAADISRRHVPEFLRRHIRGESRIPVLAVIGNGAAAEAKARMLQGQMNRRGLRCWLTRATATLDPATGYHALAADRLFSRVRALLLRDDVDALVVQIEDEALLESGLPVDRIEQVIDLRPLARGQGQAATKAGLDRLRRLLESYRKAANEAQNPS
jgi:cyanophycin synthetase